MHFHVVRCLFVYRRRFAFPFIWNRKQNNRTKCGREWQINIHYKNTRAVRQTREYWCENDAPIRERERERLSFSLWVLCVWCSLRLLASRMRTVNWGACWSVIFDCNREAHRFYKTAMCSASQRYRSRSAHEDARKRAKNRIHALRFSFSHTRGGQTIVCEWVRCALSLSLSHLRSLRRRK